MIWPVKGAQLYFLAVRRDCSLERRRPHVQLQNPWNSGDGHLSPVTRPRLGKGADCAENGDQK